MEDKGIAKEQPTCAFCGTTACRLGEEEKYPPFCMTPRLDAAEVQASVEEYLDDDVARKIALVSAGIQHDYFKRIDRATETVLFIKRMGYRRVGVACCTALVKEARVFCQMLQVNGIDFFSLSCKAGAVDKSRIGIPEEQKIHGPGTYESMCNPVLQAKKLAEEGCDFNVLLGLCVGHDSLFMRYAQAPCTVLVCKDPVTHHCPAQVLTPEGLAAYKPVE